MPERRLSGAALIIEEMPCSIKANVVSASVPLVRSRGSGRQPRLQHLAGDVGHRNLERLAETGEPQAQVAQVRFTLVGFLFGCDPIKVGAGGGTRTHTTFYGP